MNKTISAPWFKLKRELDRADCRLISALQALCEREDKISFKLELDYKLAAAENRSGTGDIREKNEFMCFDGETLIGYMGICGFGGRNAPLEITGMTHPDYRNSGVFGTLHGLVAAECARRNRSKVLLLCDRKSVSGQRFIKKLGAAPDHSEYEMYLKYDTADDTREAAHGVMLRKATNADTGEIARQNRIYFSDESERESGGNEEPLMPEEEEKRGMTVYLAVLDGKVIGKVHVQLSGSVGGIYGLGVLPEYRGRRLGRAVLLLAVEKIREAKAENIMLQVSADNETALSLYKSCGFTETSVMDYFAFRL